MASVEIDTTEPRRATGVRLPESLARWAHDRSFDWQVPMGTVVAAALAVAAIHEGDVRRVAEAARDAVG